MQGALWTHGALPWPYVRLILCRDVFHCTPPVLDAIPAEDINVALAILEAENRVRSMDGGA